MKIKHSILWVLMYVFTFGFSTISRAQSRRRIEIEGRSASSAQVGRCLFHPYAITENPVYETKLDLRYFLKISGDTVDCRLPYPDDAIANDNLHGLTETLIVFTINDFDISKYMAKLTSGYNHLIIKPRQRNPIKSIHISYFDNGSAIVRFERPGHKPPIVFKGKVEEQI